MIVSEIMSESKSIVDITTPKGFVNIPPSEPRNKNGKKDATVVSVPLISDKAISFVPSMAA